MILTLMYHRVSYYPNCKSPQTAFKKHLTTLANKYPILVPGDISGHKISLCLAFDDAYCDFYYQVFPLLQKLNIKAVLAVPTKYIVDDTNLSIEARIAAMQKISMPPMQSDKYKTLAPFCTWRELKYMQQSNLVTIASHSYSHANLTNITEKDLTTEIITSKQILAKNLNVPVDTFVYPYGKTNKKIHQIVMQHYKYAMRIGGAINKNWHNHNNYIYRIDAEHFWPKGKIFNKKDLVKYMLKYLSNTLRGK